MYKMLTCSINPWKKIGVEVIKYNDEKQVNEKNLETALGDKNLVCNETQYYSDEYKKKDMNYRIVKIFSLVENLLQKNQQFV